MNNDFWAAIVAALSNCSTYFRILAILVLLTCTVRCTYETIFLFFLHLALGVGRFLLLGILLRIHVR